MEKGQKKMLGENKGITLIALVITLIVLLILAGVSIATLTGDNGILNQAQRAKEETEIATDEEQRKLAMAEAAMNFENTEYNGVPIPAGFAPTRIEGENTVNEGLVIIDSEGNEFVWIPCGDDIAKTVGAIPYSTIYYGSAESAQAAKKGNLYEGNGNPGTYWRSCDGYVKYQDYYDHGRTDSTDIVYKWEDNGGDINSVEKYGGFYVGRYEAGLPKELWNEYNNEYKFTYKNESDVSKNRRDATDESGESKVNYIPVSKKNTPCWNFISPDFAEDASARMYSDNLSVKSQLIDSYAWDTIVEWIKSDPKVSNNVTDSTTYGNTYDSDIMVNGWYSKARMLTTSWTWISFDDKYSKLTGSLSSLKSSLVDNNQVEDIEIATGASEDTKTKNIYDLAGNMVEFTTERGGLWIHESNIYSCVRGGNCHFDGDYLPVCSRKGSNSVSPIGGFRVVLYLK